MDKKKIMLSLWVDGQKRLDILKARFPGQDTALEAAYFSGWMFAWDRWADVEAVAGNVTPEEFETVRAQFELEYANRRAAELQ